MDALQSAVADTDWLQTKMFGSSGHLANTALRGNYISKILKTNFSFNAKRQTKCSKDQTHQIWSLQRDPKLSATADAQPPIPPWEHRWHCHTSRCSAARNTSFQAKSTEKCQVHIGLSYSRCNVIKRVIYSTHLWKRCLAAWTCRGQCECVTSVCVFSRKLASFCFSFTPNLSICINTEYVHCTEYIRNTCPISEHAFVQCQCSGIRGHKERQYKQKSSAIGK